MDSSSISALMLVMLWLAGVCLALRTNVFDHLQNIGLVKVPLDFAALAARATHGLLWWQVLRGGWALWRRADASDAWLVVGAVLWLLLLLGFQLLCLLVWYVFSTPAGSSEPWLQF